MMLSDVLDLLGKVKQTGNGFTALCPAHEDRNASLSITEGSDGVVLIHCHAGCSGDDVRDALNLSWAAFFPEAESPNPRRPYRTPVAYYTYENENSEPIFRAVKYRLRNGDKTYGLQAYDGHGGWLETLGGVGKTLYRLPDVVRAREMGRRVIYVEGEKDVDTLHQLGLAATTHPGGAGGWRPEYAATLDGAEVVLLPDNDPPGRKMAAAMVADVRGLRVIDLPGLPEKGDVSDWMKAGHTKDDLLKILGPELSDQHPVFWFQFHEEQDQTRFHCGNFLAEETINMLCAEPEVGKTTLINQLCVCLAAGEPFLGFSVPEPVCTLLVEAEGSRSIFRSRTETTRKALGISAERLRNTWAIQSKHFDDFRLMAPAIERHIQEAKAKIVVLDTLGYFYDKGDENLSKDWKKEIALPLRRLKSMYGCAFILLHHTGKPSEWRQGADRGRGTSAMRGDCDTWISLDKANLSDEHTEAASEYGMLEAIEGERRLSWLKSKVGKKPKPMVLGFDDDAAFFYVKEESHFEKFRKMLAKPTARRSRSSDTDDAFSRGDRIAP